MSVVLVYMTAVVIEAHSCDVPWIPALPVVGGNPDFIKWIEDETM